MVSINDFKDVNGKVNWTAYREAEIQQGERCYKCDQFIGILGEIKNKRLCYSCSHLSDNDEINHEVFIRCPKCKHTYDPRETDEYEVFGEGTHSVYCGECGFKFLIETKVEYSFDSPELIPEEKKE